MSPEQIRKTVSENCRSSEFVTENELSEILCELLGERPLSESARVGFSNNGWYVVSGSSPLEKYLRRDGDWHVTTAYPDGHWPSCDAAEAALAERKRKDA